MSETFETLTQHPPLDARMDGDAFVAFLDVPDLAEAPTIYLGRDRLVVEGLTTGTGDAARDPRARRPFAREVALPPDLDRDQLRLDYVGGVLGLHIPARAMPRAA